VERGGGQRFESAVGSVWRILFGFARVGTGAVWRRGERNGHVMSGWGWWLCSLHARIGGIGAMKDICYEQFENAGS
jgi:hypothetical protein